MRTHTEDNPYEYNHCDKTLAEKGNLDIHWRNHTEEKSFNPARVR